MFESWHHKLFDSFPEPVDAGPGDHFFHFAEKFVGIVYPGYVFDDGNEEAGDNGVEVDGANKADSFKQKVKKQADIEFSVKNETFVEETFQPELLIRHDSQWNRAGKLPADDGNSIARAAEGRADTDHPLVVIQIIGNRKNEFFRPVHSLPECDNINGK